MRTRSAAMAMISGAVIVSGCVTINVYFPAAAAEKAADKIIEEVWQLQKQGSAPSPAAPTPSPITPK